MNRDMKAEEIVARFVEHACKKSHTRAKFERRKDGRLVLTHIETDDGTVTVYLIDSDAALEESWRETLRQEAAFGPVEDLDEADAIDAALHKFQITSVSLWG